ncbi:hypothetical protein Tco_1324036 [Tanacetum coccineum]
MDDPNITIEEYIRLEEEKARKRGKVFNWETAKYGKIWYDEDVHDLRSVETQFPAIVFNNNLTMKITRFVMELIVNIVAWNYLVNGMLFDLIKNLYVSFGIPFNPKWYYKDGVYTRCCGGQDMALPPRDQRHQYLRFEGLQYTEGDIADFETRLARIYRREGQSVFTSQAWWRLFDIRGSLQRRCRLMVLAYIGLRVRDRSPTRGDLRDYWIRISSTGDFLGTTPSYTSIRDQILRLCHRLIACSIAIWNQSPEKLADTWSWVSPGPERQPDAAAGAPEAAKDALVADEGALAVPTPVQAPQTPPPAAAPAQTMAQRLARVEEDVHEIRGALGE